MGPHSTSRKTLLIVVPLAVVVLLILRFQPQARSMVADFAGPFLKARQLLGWRVRESSQFAKSKVELIRELEDLRAELDNEALAERELDLLRTENAELRQQLALAARTTYRVVAAHILLRDPANGGRTYVIDRGEASGLNVGQPVLLGGNLDGRVLSTSRHTARVLSITDPNCKISVRIAGTRHHGILEGRGTNQWQADPYCIARYLPRDVEYREGMVVETSEFGLQVPPGLPVGVLAPIAPEPLVTNVDNLYKSVTVSPYSTRDAATHTYVTVILASLPPGLARELQALQRESP